MEFDPLSREAPPPRHQLESDSESDGEGQGPPSSSRPSSLRPTREDGAPRIEHVLDADADAESQTSWKGRPLVVLLGPAGEAWAASHPALENATEDAKVLVDGVQVRRLLCCWKTKDAMDLLTS